MEESFVGEEERNHARERPIFHALDTFRGHAPFLSIFPINSVGGGTLEECLSSLENGELNYSSTKTLLPRDFSRHLVRCYTGSGIVKPRVSLR